MSEEWGEINCRDDLLIDDFCFSGPFMELLSPFANFEFDAFEP